MTAPLIVVTGATGQLGQTLSRLWVESPLPQYQLKALDRSELDISQVATAIAVLSALKPAVIVNHKVTEALVSVCITFELETF